MVVIGLMIFLAGVGWATQLVFTASRDTNDSVWTVIGIVISLAGATVILLAYAMRPRRS
jgi:hypothetical protein